MEPTSLADFCARLAQSGEPLAVKLLEACGGMTDVGPPHIVHGPGPEEGPSALPGEWQWWLDEEALDLSWQWWQGSVFPLSVSCTVTKAAVTWQGVTNHPVMVTDTARILAVLRQATALGSHLDEAQIEALAVMMRR